ncbi:MAG: hypothetical protein HEQ38_15670 [Gemmatimonas sp.]|jgi:hypothetical protein|uniref:hypothetical protein n=1 Tax=Gemmatimonas sp. TaxID=1962908 RepID=UPI0031CBA658|nr:hypothetical protein [Gemmatimonas sp.]
MTSPSSSGDAFARVSAALQVVWPVVADPAAGLTRAETGRVLDECGSDYRPLVLLLLDIGQSVRPVLQGMTPQPAGQWPHVRAPLVHKLVSTRYLQSEVARWAVDVWGQVLGIAPPPEPPRLPESATAWVSPATTTAATAPTRSSLARPPVLSPRQVPAARRQTPSWAGGPVSFRVGQTPKASTMAALAQGGRIVVRGTVSPGPRFSPTERRAAMVLGLLLVIITVGLMNALAGRPDVTTPVDAVDAGLGAMTNSGGASTASEALMPVPLASPSVPSIPDSDMAPAPAPPDVGAQRLAARGQIREAGVGGRYLVTQRVRDVSGSESCDAVAGALAGGRETEEIVAHVPGTDRFTLVTRGVTGTLDADGQFNSQPRAGTTNNVTWQFQMRGRFGPDGFTGESITHTDAILRWGKQQICVVTADLSGQRLPD